MVLRGPLSPNEGIGKVGIGNAKSIEEVSKTASEQLQAVSAIVDGSEDLASLAEELRGVLRAFRIGQKRSGMTEFAS